MPRFLFFGLLLLSGVLVLVGVGPGRAAPSAPPPPAAKPAAPDSSTTVVLNEGFEYHTGLQIAETELVSRVPTCTPGGCHWVGETTLVHTGANAAHAPAVAGVAEQLLVLRHPILVPADATAAGLTFWHRYAFETPNYDGGVLEFSTDGSIWTDAGSYITAGGYTGTIDGTHGNPLAGRAAWVGIQSTYTQVTVNLIAYAGQTLYFRLRLGTDATNGTAGWYVDDVVASYTAPLPCSPANWLQAAAYPTPILHTVVAAQGGRLYSFGGNLPQNVNITQSYKYDVAANTWTAIASLPAARALGDAVSDGTYIYILGGLDTNHDPTNTVYRYDPATNTYFTLAPLPTATAAHGAVFLDGKIYRIGGVNQANQRLNTVDVYTIATNQWAPGPAYPITVSGLRAVAWNGYIYAAGGYTGSVYTAKTYRFDPATNTWDDGAIADLPAPRHYAADGVLNGRWIIAGGDAGGLNPETMSAVTWSPLTNTWVSLAQMPIPPFGPGSAVVGQSFYVVGGISPVGYLTAVQQYTEPECGPSPCTLQFTDVPADSPFYTYVRCLACRGIVSGYSTSPPCATGSPCFQPGANVTRGQMAKFVANAAGYADVIPSTQQTFTDVPSSNPFWLYVERAVLHGVISGYTASPPCTTGVPCFLPGNEVTRGQTAKFVSNAVPYTDVIPSSQQTFTDVPASSPFWLYVERAYLHGVISGYTTSPPCTTGVPCFTPGNAVTRGQTSKFISNGFFPGCVTPGMASAP
ncbi:MAG TPA: kelch repeat-containing protein [Chloroflexia bacterium]|nr:kelch repeat-containing protein [Chloroflexia bacterium]